MPKPRPRPEPEPTPTACQICGVPGEHYAPRPIVQLRSCGTWGIYLCETCAFDAAWFEQIELAKGSRWA